VKYKDIILVDINDFKRAVAVLEDAGIEVSIPTARFSDRE